MNEALGLLTAAAEQAGLPQEPEQPAAGQEAAVARMPALPLPQDQDQEPFDAAEGNGTHSSPSGGWDPRHGVTEFPDGLPGDNVGSGPKYKRGRGRSFFKEQPKKGAVCQVPGCDRSLHKLRDYYKRYKICPHHLELPCLVVEGQTIRFCQQCGRFQLLTDFEGDRRSCRRKLDKHNERRRKAELEQKSRMLDSPGEDSPGKRGVKAPRPSPWRGGTVGAPGMFGFEEQVPFLMMGGGGHDGDMANRLKQLSADPMMMQQGLPAGLLQTLSQPIQPGGMDWLGLAGQASYQQQQQQQPQPQHAAIPQHLMSLLPADVQQMVQLQGAGVLDAALVAQLQQAASQQAGPLVQHMPARPARPFGFGLFGGSQPAQQQQQQQLMPVPAASPAYSAPLPVAAPSLPGPSQLQQLQQMRAPHTQMLSQHQHTQHPQHRSNMPQPQHGFPLPQDLALAGVTDATANAFWQQVQRQQQQQQQQQQDGAAALPVHQGQVPLLRSNPMQGMEGPGRPGAAADLSKADLLVALASTVGVSRSELSRALQDGGLASLAAPHISQQQQQQQQGSDTDPMHASPSGPHSLSAPAADSAHQPNSSGGGACGGVNSCPPSHQQQQQQQQQQPGSAFTHVQQLQHPSPSAGRPSEAPAVPGPSAGGMMDLDRVQSAVETGGLHSGFSSDAKLLLQLVEAVEQAQSQAGVGSERMHSLALKLFNCTPDRLPKNILEQLEEWMVQNKTLLDGAARPGCVQLSLSAMLNDGELRHLTASFADLVEQLARCALSDLRTGVLAQSGRQAVVVDASGRRVMQLDLASSGEAVPEISSVRPLAVTPSYQGPILVTGRHVGGEGDTIYCRNGGEYPTTEVLGHGMLLTAPAGQHGAASWALLRIPALKEGCHQMEAQRGMLVGPPHSLLVLDDEEAVAELRQLELPTCSVRDVPELLHRLGVVLRFGGSADPAGHGGEALRRRVQSAAQELAATCILRRWPAVLRLVLPQTCLQCPPGEALAGVERHLCGIPVLHAAALMGGAAVVRTLGAWAAHAGCPLSLGARWGGGLTALHVAALLRQPEDVALALTDLSPATAPEDWAAAFAAHGEETPLGLACRLNKRGLLAVLAGHGVPAAGALLAALEVEELEHGPAGDAPAPPLPCGVEGTFRERERQRRQWNKVYGSLYAEQASVRNAVVLSKKARAAGMGYRASKGGAEWVAPLLPYRQYGSDPTGVLRSGDTSPSSVLLPIGRFHPKPASGQAGQGRRQRAGSGWSSATDGEAEAGELPAAQGEAAELPTRGPQAEPAAAACVVNPAAAWDGSDSELLGKYLKARVCGPEVYGAGIVGSAPELRLRRARLFLSPKAWRYGKAGIPTAHLLMLLLLFIGSLSLALCPSPLRRTMHAWLLATVARAPLTFQPVLLLCPPVHGFYRSCSKSVLVSMHAVMFGLQYAAAHAHGTGWLFGNALLASHSAGLWLLAAVVALQLCAALHRPALFIAYCANLLLLPVTCQCLGSCISPLRALYLALSGRQLAFALAAASLLGWAFQTVRALQAPVRSRCVCS